MRRSAGLLCALTPLVAACELEEVTGVDVEPVVIAEVYVDVAEDPDQSDILAFLHWTAGIDTATVPTLSASTVTVRRADGFTTVLVEAQIDDCAGSLTPEHAGACFLADPDDAPRLRAGDLLEVDVRLPDGGTLTGATRVPSEFELLGVPAQCRLDPNRLMTIRWTRADGAWAYVNETSIRGLPAALDGEGIEVEDDPLYLLGLSISDSDTTIVFPSEFGVFNRFDLDQALALRLQRGLPRPTVAEVSITAVEGNYVNWARGGNFNPSGQVRVPSLSGDGTGVFAATVRRSFVVVADGPGGGIPECPGTPG